MKEFNLENIHKQNFDVSRADREGLNGHKSRVIWITGLSGSGKSTIASAVEKDLFDQGIHTHTLDGDNIRLGINKNLGFDRESRVENIRRIAEIAKLNCDAGLLTICCFISPLETDRALAQEIIGKEDFSLIFVDCPIEVCIERDVKGLYKKALAGEIENFTGISAPYDKPEDPDIRIDSAKMDLNTSRDKIVQHILKKIKL